MDGPITIPLKLKYRNPDSRVIKTGQTGEPPSGTLIYNAGSYKAKSSNSGSKQSRGIEANLRPRRRSYGPF